MRISKEYLPEKGIVVLTVENPPLPEQKHTILASALVDGSVSLQGRIDELRVRAEEDLRIHNEIIGMMGE